MDEIKINREVEQLKKSINIDRIDRISRTSKIISFIIIPLMFALFVYGAFRLNTLYKNIENTKKELIEKEKEIDKYNTLLNSLSYSITNMQESEKVLFDFFDHLLNTSNTIDYSVNWESTKEEIMSLPSGDRKKAILNALVTTWREIPFNMQGDSPKSGFNSSSFMLFVLNSVGVTIDDKPNIYLSVDLMNSFKRTETPEPGDLIFYKGAVGYFGVIYLSKGKPNGKGVGVGTLETANPLGIYETSNFNTEYFSFFGYYKVKYNDEN